MKRYLIIVSMAVVACNSNSFAVKDDEKKTEANAPSASEQIANAQIEARRESVTKSVTLGDHRYTVKSKGDGSIRSLLVADLNLKEDTTKVKADTTEIHDVKGFLTDIAIADLDKDGHPEVYCFTQSKGTETTGSVYALSYMNNKATTINTAALSKIDMEGYKGRDSFYVQVPYLVRTYPLYKADDQETTPSGGTKTTKYTLKNGTLTETK